MSNGICATVIVMVDSGKKHESKRGKQPTEAADSSTTAVSRVKNEVLEGLSMGRYVPGQRLIAAELAAKLGTSQIPVREALHILSGYGVVELVPRRGARISAMSATEFLDFLEVWVPMCRLNFICTCERLADSDKRADYAAETEYLHHIIRDLEIAAQKRISIDFFHSYIKLYDTCAAINKNKYFLNIRNVLPVELYYRHVADILPGPLWEKYHRNIRDVIESILTGDSEAFVKIWDAHAIMVREYLEMAINERAWQ